MSNPLKKLAGQTAVYGLSSIVGRLLNYLMVPLYVGVFVNTSDYGVVSELYAWIAFLMVLLTFGMETAFFKFLSDDPENKEKIFRNSMLSIIVVNIVFLLLILFFNGVIADKLLFPNNPEYIILLGIIVVIDATSALPLAKLRAEERAKKFVLVQLTGIGLNIGLNLILIWSTPPTAKVTPMASSTKWPPRARAAAVPGSSTTFVSRSMRNHRLEPCA